MTGKERGGRARWPLTWWAPVWAVATAAGCMWSGGPAYQSDPLLLIKKHVEGKASQTAPALLLARAEPAVPHCPDMAWVARPVPKSRAPEVRAQIPDPAPVDQPPPAKAGVPAVPAVRTKVSPEVPAIPVLRREEGLQP